MPPHPRRRSIEWPSSNHRFSPDIIEEILLKLPIKSLIRFRCVCKSWKSMFSESWFIRKHLSAAALRRKTLFIVGNDNTFSYPLSSIYNSNEIKISYRFGNDVKLKAYCEELWCISTVEDGLCLWNPSLRSYRKLPRPRFFESVTAVYGLCYDSADEDYKVLKVNRYNRSFLYSLRSDSWIDTKIPFPGNGNCFPDRSGEFVNGAFHWMVIDKNPASSNYAPVSSSIISFNLRSYKYKTVPQPEFSPRPKAGDNLGLVVLREMLCVWVNYRCTSFVLWAMKEYGVEESWSEIYEISLKSIRFIREKVGRGTLVMLQPLYLYENGDVLICVCGEFDDWEIFIYQRDRVVARRRILNENKIDLRVAFNNNFLGFNIVLGQDMIVRRKVHAGFDSNIIRAGYVYVESLISLAR